MIRRPSGLATEGVGLVVIAAVAIGLLDLLPALRLLGEAVAPGGTFAPGAALAVVSGRAATRATLLTLETAAVSALLASALGTAFALVVGITDIRARGLFGFLFVLTLMIAPQVTALAFLTLAGPSSPLLGALGLAPEPGRPNPLLGAGGIDLVLGLHHAPLVFIVVASGLKRISPSLIEAAEMEGASPATIARRVVLPLLRPHLVSACLLAFVAGVGNFGIPALLGLPVNALTLPTLIYRRLSSFGPEVIGDVAALGLMASAIAGAGAGLSTLALRRAAVVLEDERPLRPFWRLGRLRVLPEALLALVLVGVLVLPLSSLAAASLVPSYGIVLSPSSATLDNYLEVLWRQRATTGALRNSFLLAAAAAAATALMSLVVAYVLARRAGRFGPLLAGLVEIPYALPGIVLAVVTILLFLKPLPLLGVSLYATPWIILFAYLARFLPVVLKPVLAAVAQLDRAQEDAAALDGAGPLRRLASIILPNLLPAAAAGAVLVFLMAFNELTVSALLWSAGTETVGVVFFSLEEAGLIAPAAALAVTTVLLVAAAMLLLDRIRSGLPEGVLPWRP